VVVPEERSPKNDPGARETMPLPAQESKSHRRTRTPTASRTILEASRSPIQHFAKPSIFWRRQLSHERPAQYAIALNPSCNWCTIPCCRGFQKPRHSPYTEESRRLGSSSNTGSRVGFSAIRIPHVEDGRYSFCNSCCHVCHAGQVAYMLSL
jgi:aldehyde:ferredoxin oxidoreductase